MKKSFWRKHYTGYTSGTLAGRDDGYPEPRHIDFKTPEGVAANHGQQDEERYEYIVQETRSLDETEVKLLVASGKAQLEAQKITKQKQKDEAEFLRLADKLADTGLTAETKDAIADLMTETLEGDA